MTNKIAKIGTDHDDVDEATPDTQGSGLAVTGKPPPADQVREVLVMKYIPADVDGTDRRRYRSSKRKPNT